MIFGEHHEKCQSIGTVSLIPATNTRLIVSQSAVIEATPYL